METTGCGTAIVTPFRADGSVDEAALQALVNWQIDSGIDFLVACGSTGEAATLDEDEWLKTVSLVGETAAGRVPGWCGWPADSSRFADWARCCRPIPTTTSLRRRASSSTFWPWPRPLPRCLL